MSKFNKIKGEIRRYLDPDIRELRKRIHLAILAEKKSPSVLFFTTHKCASSFMDKLFNMIANESDLRVVDYANTISHLADRTNIDEPFSFLEANYDMLYHQRGEIYVPCRRPLDFPGRDDIHQIYFLRDPRDVLVSAFHSFSKTHAPPPSKRKSVGFYEYRRKINEMGIDQFALFEAENWLLPIYEKYKIQRESAKSAKFFSYDYYKQHTEEFVKEVARFSGISIPDELARSIANLASPLGATIQPDQHKRSGKSGQYEDALLKETVIKLNGIFSDQLEYWDFK